jgi:hypothetical protein
LVAECVVVIVVVVVAIVLLLPKAVLGYTSTTSTKK